MTQQKTYRWLLISIALNIFLVAFVLGRVMPHGPMHGPHGGMRGEGPPPFIGMRALFTEQEMRDDMPFAKQRFDKIRTLRDEFAKHLGDEKLSEKVIISHFDAVDKVMDELKDHMKEKAVAKIKAMSVEERQDFAQKLLQEKDHPPRPPHQGDRSEKDRPPHHEPQDGPPDEPEDD